MHRGIETKIKDAQTVPAFASQVLCYLIDTSFNFNFILPKVNTDYIRQAQVLNIDNTLD